MKSSIFAFFVEITIDKFHDIKNLKYNEKF